MKALVRSLSLFTVVFAVSLICGTSSAQEKIERTADGRPDINGIWQAISAAHWNLEPHDAEASPVVAMGALGAISGGLGVVEGGRIPYKSEALRKRNDNKAHWLERDPAVKCYLPGVPRATYLPHPFQIFLAPKTTLITYEFAGADRIVYMDRPESKAQVDSWMGYNLGHWEGDTLVINVTAQMEDTWLDSAGNFHGPGMRVQERYTPLGPNALMYEAIIIDNDVYTEPWKIRLPLYRRLETNAQLLEFKCVEFVEELLYGKYRKPGTK